MGMKMKPIQYMNSKVGWKNSQGTNGNKVPPQAQDPMAIPSVQEMVLKDA